MESNNNDYVLVLEDRTAVKNEQEVGTLSIYRFWYRRSR